MTDDWPTLGEELARKALGALEEAMWKHDEGEMTKEALFAVINALADTTQGLIPKDAFNLIYNVRKELS